MPGIYCFKNLTNGKCYIGQAKDLRKRYYSHMSNYSHHRYTNPLYLAFDKYGLESFDYSIIEIIPEYYLPELDALEIYYIKQYNSYGGAGYNQTKGGDGGVLGYKMTEEQKAKISCASKAQDNGTHCYTKNIQTQEITVYQSISEVATALNVSRSVIQARLNHRSKVSEVKGYYISQYKDFHDIIVNSELPNSGQFVAKFTLLEFLNKLNEIDFKNKSVKEIIEALGICKKTYYNYIKLLQEHNLIESDLKIATSKQHYKNIRQYDSKGNLLNTFSTIAKAAQWIIDNKLSNSNIKTVDKSIRDVCKNVRQSAYKYLWEAQLY